MINNDIDFKLKCIDEYNATETLWRDNLITNNVYHTIQRSLLWAIIAHFKDEIKTNAPERDHRRANKQIDELIGKINTDLSTYMFDENGNETLLHKDIMNVIEEYKKGENVND